MEGGDDGKTSDVADNGLATEPPNKPPSKPAASDPASQQLKETILKYKKLLSMARQGLEDNQRHLSDKDEQIRQLQHELESSKQRNAKENAKTRGLEMNPKRIVRRVDQDGVIWVLFEWYSVETDARSPPSWREFNSYGELEDFVQCVSGEPIEIPPACLTSDETQQKINDAKAEVKKTQEEFRKYKIKSEIARKQKEAETKQALGAGLAEASRRIAGADLEVQARRGREARAQADALRQELAQQELMWRKAHDALAKENAKLRSAGGEPALAAQWRQRYEACAREKEELAAAAAAGAGGGGGGEGAASAGGGQAILESKYRRLKEEYKEYRRQAMAALNQQRAAGAAGEEGAGGGGGQGAAAGAGGVIKGTFANGASIPGSSDSKVQYLKNLMFQYLCTAESESKETMQRAIYTVLRFTPEEQAKIKEAQVANSGVAGQVLSSIWGAAHK